MQLCVVNNRASASGPSSHLQCVCLLVLLTSVHYWCCIQQ